VNCAERVQTSDISSATVLTRRESNKSHHRRRRDVRHKTVLSSLVGPRELGVAAWLSLTRVYAYYWYYPHAETGL